MMTQARRIGKWAVARFSESRSVRFGESRHRIA